ncbi:hypothetical protein HHL17_26220 [Chitinophaga sp. G-6-1-13]|uniref:Uncharacterized protein n=1 Tax=Chitinophaga fulva TaxID=2728842 RepID=A0A848GTB1_9BACT|nr:hypothetical protein [Chitinophaga fulva]NML40721.1 hypothetical protein [Chitinophaga fulva]
MGSSTIQKPLIDSTHQVLVKLADTATKADTTTHGAVEHMLKYINKTTGVDANTTFTIIVTFIIFGFGLLATWIVSFIGAANARKSYKKSVNLLLFNFAQECKKNHDLMTKSLENVSIVQKHAVGFQLKVIAHLYFLEKIDYSVFLKHYVRCCNKSLKTKAVTEVFQIIGSIKEMEEGALKNMENFTDLLNKRQEDYLTSLFEIERFFERNFLTLKVVDYAVKQECITIYNNWRTLRHDTFIANSFNNLIVPLKVALDKFPNEKNLDSLYIMVDNCYRAYPDLQHVDRLIKSNFQPLAQLSYHAYRKTKVILKIFGYKKYKA